MLGMLDADEHEILHLYKRMELDGNIYDREVAYMSDHQIFHRLAINGAWAPWERWKLWKKLDEVYSVARVKKEKGWEVTFHPAYSPDGAEFIRSVPL